GRARLVLGFPAPRWRVLMVGHHRLWFLTFPATGQSAHAEDLPGVRLVSLVREVAAWLHSRTGIVRRRLGPPRAALAPKPDGQPRCWPQAPHNRKLRCTHVRFKHGIADPVTWDLEMKADDPAAGMDQPIARREFLNSVAIAAGSIASTMLPKMATE